jgi:hypothetical protein
MRAHVPETRLLDVLEGSSGADRDHLDACAECRSRLDEARAGLALALKADVPEPSPLYWDSLRRQVSQRLDEDSARRPARRWSWLPPALAAAALLVGVVTFVPRATPPPGPVAEAPLPAWSALPPADEDAGLDVLRAVAPAVADAAPSVGCDGVVECLADLSDEESQALAEHLSQELGTETENRL